ncbi:MAG: serine/threonine-protein kinase [Planctomycetota bacterium]
MQVGPYRVVSEIARGGMGVVYRALAPDRREVALKVLLCAESSHARARLEREVQALSRLRHPHVVQLLGAGELQGRPWLAMEFVHGETLAERLRRGPLSIPDAVRLGQQLASALRYVHDCGLLHRDLKPDNVLLRGADALLTDFGLVLDEHTEGSRITATGVFQGTPGYWAPEQAFGDKHGVGPWTDVYGLGAVLYAALTGRPPVEGQSLAEHLASHRFRQTVPPRERRPDVPLWLSELCLRCLAQQPDARPASADVVARALASEGAVGLAPTRAGRGWAPWAGGLVALGVGLGLTWAAVVATGGEPAEEPRRGEVPAAPPRAEDPAAPNGQAQAEEAHALREEGAKAIMSDRLQEALELLDRALELNPRDAQALRERGVAKGRLGQREAAIADYDLALELDPGDAVSWHNRGRNLAQLGRYAEAQESYDRALEITPGYVNALNDRGACKGYLGDFAGAIADYDRVLKTLRDPSAYLNRGVCKARLGRVAEGIADLDLALEIHPGYGRALATRAALHVQLEDYARAAADYATLAEATPQDPQVWIQLGVNQARCGRYAEAVVAFDRAEALGVREVTLYRDRATCKSKLERWADAILDYDAALELTPEDPDLSLGRGIARSALDRDAEALTDFDAVLRQRPGDAYARVNRASCLQALGRNAEAVREYDRAVELEPELAPQVAPHRAEAAAATAGD